MTQQRSCLNGRRLIISNRKNFRADLDEANAIPRVALLSAWEIGEVSLSVWESVVDSLLKLGCTYFVCAGDFAEELHDLVDDIVLRQTLGGTVATSFHDGESPEDVINFFVYTTTFEEDNRHALLAILDPTRHQDDFMLKLLEQQ